jgi:hypothetical protein
VGDGGEIAQLLEPRRWIEHAKALLETGIGGSAWRRKDSDGHSDGGSLHSHILRLTAHSTGFFESGLTADRRPGVTHAGALLSFL